MLLCVFYDFVTFGIYGITVYDLHYLWQKIQHTP